ncbi:transcriptional regulator [Vibrio sp. UCD-FRSSP16_10]|uniref:ChrR family anti-sigma-E factor n=1 Tax=unclassified Vibrio TaxID=2614977 RepID=UPI0007FCEED0|nr:MULTISPECIES: ChrR family anti-sigma-E factor [unclassified Vibrio]OBT06558.1 transcriptional regulator [Vibrio sp. UCD-FRSSP16_30]OBT12255.1 transcriptional regulator [Vibrio sp. UCD-FRSSP16_10]
MKYHPSNELLKAYTEGSIDACNGLTLAAHLENCHHCQSKVEELESQVSQGFVDFEQQPTADIENEASMMEAMFNEITSLDKKPITIKRPKVAQIEVNGKKFPLPRSLQNISTRLSSWKNYGGKVYTAHLDIGEQQRVNLLYIKGGVQVPQHTHRGIETTLVLHGRFSDEDGEYTVGDFMVADASIKHTPRTEEGQDCLCLTVLSEPMIFTQGVARIFNLFGRGMYP